MTSERVTLPSCDHTKLVCPAITWAGKEIERLNAYQDRTAMAWTKLTESLEREIEQLRDLLENARSNYVAGSGPDQEWDARRDEAVRRSPA